MNSSGTLHANDGFLLSWDTSTGELKRAAGGIDNRPEAVFPSPDGEKAVVIGGHNAGTAEWWDLKAGKRLKVLAGGKDDVYYYGASADGTKFGGSHYKYVEMPNGGRSGNPEDVWVWDIATGERLKDLPVQTSYPVRFTPDGKTLLVRDTTAGNVQFVPTGGGKPVTLWKNRPDTDGFVLPQEPVPLAGGESFVGYIQPRQYDPFDLYIWDAGRQIQFGSADVHTGPLAVSPDGKWVACGGMVRDKLNPVYLWKLPDLGPLDEKKLKAGEFVVGTKLAKRVQLDGHIGEVFAVAFSPDGKTLATGGRDKLIRIWDVQTGKLKASLWAVPPTDRDAVPTDWVAFTPDGTHTGTARGRAFLRFAEGDGSKLHNAEKVRDALRSR